METTSKINEFLDSLSKLPVEDQLMISKILRSRAIEEKRSQLANAIKVSREEYYKKETGKGSVEDFLRELDS